MAIERDAESDDRHLEDQQPQPAGEEKARVVPAAGARAAEEGARPGEEDEDRGAEVRDPPGGEEGGVGGGEVGRIAGEAAVDEVAAMVEDHEDHDQAAEEVDAVVARPPTVGHQVIVPLAEDVTRLNFLPLWKRTQGS